MSGFDSARVVKGVRRSWFLGPAKLWMRFSALEHISVSMEANGIRLFRALYIPEDYPCRSDPFGGVPFNLAGELDSSSFPEPAPPINQLQAINIVRHDNANPSTAQVRKGPTNLFPSFGLGTEGRRERFLGRIDVAFPWLSSLSTLLGQPAVLYFPMVYFRRSECDISPLKLWYCNPTHQVIQYGCRCGELTRVRGKTELATSDHRIQDLSAMLRLEQGADD